jgi:carboxyl-terminal processing protease
VKRIVPATLATLATLTTLATLLATGCARAPRPAPLTPSERARELQSFDHVWTTVRDKHWDPALGGLDWGAIRDSLRPRVERATTRAQSRAAMSALVDTLGQSHFGIIPGDVYGEMAGESGGEGTTGIDLRILDGRAVVFRVDEGSPAESLGVRPGWILVRAGKHDPAVTVPKLWEQFSGKTTRELIVTSAIDGWLRGPIGGKVEARFLDGGDREVSLRLPLVRPRGNRTQFGNLPPIYARIDTRRLDGGIGYARLSIFLDPTGVMGRFNEAMISFEDAPGVILDLRGNPGGIGAMAMGVAGWFIEGEGRRLGVMTTRETEVRFTINPRAQTLDARLAILVDGLSASTSEILAGGLQGLGRARVFGARSAGAALPSAIERLPNGDGFQYAFASYVSEGGVVLEGSGVAPDVPVTPTREALLREEDPVLDAAVAWIRDGR